MAEKESTDASLEESQPLQSVAGYIEVLREDDPPTPRHLGEPLGVLGPRREVVVMQLNDATGAAQRLRELLRSQAVVYEEDEVSWLALRQRAAPGVPTGSLRVCPPADG